MSGHISWGSSTHTQTGSGSMILRLNNKLVAGLPALEQRWSESSSTQMLIYRADMCGLLMAVLNNIMLVRHMSRFPFAMTTTLGKIMVSTTAALIPLAVLQLYLLHSRWQWYQAHRTRLAVANRLLRLVAQTMFAVDHKFNAVILFVAQQHIPLWILCSFSCLAPLLQLQMSTNFIVPVHIAWGLQPLHILGAAALSWNGPYHLASGQHPFMQQVAAMGSSVVCTLDVLFGCILFAGTLGVSDAQLLLPCGCFSQQRDSCSNASQVQVHAQLLLFANLLLSWFIPFYAAFMLELHSKLRFFRSQQLEVVPAASLLLPLPQHLWLSHGIVLLMAPTVAWFVVRAFVPLLYPG